MSIFTENKYTRWYHNIIDRAACRNIDGYSETHHIIPKCLGGSNDPENLVSLTAREHYLCHLLLPKMVNGNAHHKMLFALWRMAHGNANQSRHKISSLRYSKIKSAMAESIAVQNKTQVPWNKGKKTGKIPWNKGRTDAMSAEARKKISDFRKTWRKNKLVDPLGLEPR